MNKNNDMDAVRYLLESDPGQAWRPPQIAATLGLRGKPLKNLPKILRDLEAEGAAVQTKPGAYAMGKPGDLLTGELRQARNGRGFVLNADNERVWILPQDLNLALPGDSVTCRVFHAAKDEPHAKVLKVNERSGRDVVGTLTRSGGQWFVTPLDPVYRQDFAVDSPGPAKENDRVILRFARWTGRDSAPEGTVTGVIGPADQPSLDTEAVARQYDLPREFPPAVIKQAERVAARLGAPGKREDLRDTFVFTIDPEKARDFDDALSLAFDAQGRRVLGVHIADVSHFVLPGTPLDDEAFERATSVYLVDKVIPMLPEQLSNGVCSLRPGEDRLCLSAFLTFDADGKMAARRFAKTIIHSRLRLTYEQAMEIIASGVQESDLPITSTLREILHLSRQLRAARFNAGALDLEVPEVEILMDAEARMTGIRVTPCDESHQLIEECMVAANEAVATELLSRGIPVLSRLHEEPDPEKIELLQADLAVLGFKPGDLSTAKHLARFLASTQDHPLKTHAHTLVLRSMKRALYSSTDAGHFGLAKLRYSHFTSPIRRYPDLLLHRQLSAHIARKNANLPAGFLANAAAHATEREQRADDASRALIEIKKFRFLQQQIDDKAPVVYDAVVSKVTSYGLFIDVIALQLTGLVHISTLSTRHVRHDPVKNVLAVGGDTYKLGAKLRVRVARVDFNRRLADFIPDTPEHPPAPKRKKAKK
ncbi:MAG: VacB/RNase II family 3'-5' exoribonuclease [Kiritimatiellaeota bacterium]|nr:VacB/RNase II family 3'-5' exoribonuclease [Kiritimatiellota bacterium]